MFSDIVLVDAQFVYPKQLKELAFYINGQVFCYLIKPNIGYHELSESEKWQNKWLKKNLHGLSYNQGEMCTKCPLFRNVIAEHVKDARLVLAKGLEKCLVLTEILRIPVTNLEKYNCPKYAEIDKFGGDCPLDDATEKHKKSDYCAAKHVRAYGQWFFYGKDPNEYMEIDISRLFVDSSSDEDDLYDVDKSNSVVFDEYGWIVQ